MTHCAFQLGQFLNPLFFPRGTIKPHSTCTQCTAFTFDLWPPGDLGHDLLLRLAAAASPFSQGRVFKEWFELPFRIVLASKLVCWLEPECQCKSVQHLTYTDLAQYSSACTNWLLCRNTLSQVSLFWHTLT